MLTAAPKTNAGDDTSRELASNELYEKIILLNDVGELLEETQTNLLRRQRGLIDNHRQQGHTARIGTRLRPEGVSGPRRQGRSSTSNAKWLTACHQGIHHEHEQVGHAGAQGGIGRFEIFERRPECRKRR